MPRSLWLEMLVVLVLGVISVLLLLVQLLRRRKRQMAALVLVAGLFVGLSAHAAWRLENFCSRSRPHVDCVSDRYDRPLWKVFRPARRLYWEIRHILDA